MARLTAPVLAVKMSEAKDDVTAALELIGAEAGENPALGEALVRLRAVVKSMPTTIAGCGELAIVDDGYDERMEQAILQRFEDDVLRRQEVAVWLAELQSDANLFRSDEYPQSNCMCVCDACMECEGDVHMEDVEVEDADERGEPV